MITYNFTIIPPLPGYDNWGIYGYKVGGKYHPNLPELFYKGKKETIEKGLEDLKLEAIKREIKFIINNN